MTRSLRSRLQQRFKKRSAPLIHPIGPKSRIPRNYRLTRSNLTDIDLNETEPIIEDYDDNDVADYATDDYVTEYEADDYETEVAIEENLPEDPLPVESDPEPVVPNVVDEPIDVPPPAGGSFDDSIACDWYENYGHYESTPSTAYKCGEARSFICEHPRNDLVPPVMINDLSATLYEHDHLVHLTFTAPGDDEQEGVSENYEIRTAATASGFEKFREDFFEGDLIPDDFYVTQKLFRY